MKIISKSERLEQVFFYTLEKSIKSYRQFAQRSLNAVNKDITIDQWLTLKTLHDNPGIPQREISLRVFKDQASITRIIDLLVRKGLLKRSSHQQDRRRFTLELTDEGETTLEELYPIILGYRNKALEGLKAGDINRIKVLLEKVIENCSSN